MTRTPLERSPAQTLLFSSLAVAGLLAAFALSFWLVSRDGAVNWHNRAQSQLRSPNEESEANKNWDPNRLLGGFNRQLPPAESWAGNFGKPLAYTKGIDADTYLYPDGTAPAPGSLILGEGDDITDAGDNTQDALNGSTDNAFNNAAANSSRTQPARSTPDSNRNNIDDSPVGGLLNR